MILTLDEVLAEIEVDRADLTVWIEQRWVLPTRQDETLLFDVADVARVRLICELRRDMMVNEEAMPVVLSLLDQVYGLRRTLDELRAAITAASAEARAEIAARLGRPPED